MPVHERNSSPRGPRRSSVRWLSLLSLGLATAIAFAGHFAYRAYWPSERQLLSRADAVVGIGDTAEAEALLKECIRRHDSVLARAKLVELYTNAEDFAQVSLLDKVTRRPLDPAGTGVLARAFAQGYQAMAAKEFLAQEWASASVHFQKACEEYQVVTRARRLPVLGGVEVSPALIAEWTFFRVDPNGAPECLRKAIVASSKAGDSARVDRLVAIYRVDYAQQDDGSAALIDDLVALEDFDRALRFDSSDGAGQKTNAALGRAYSAVGSRAFEQEKWQSAAEHFVKAFARYREVNAGVGLECLRNAVAAMRNARDRNQVIELGEIFLAEYARNREEFERDEGLRGYRLNVESMMRD